uniref:Uncharacterized protein n=1 Tax=Avena sativa TaxID=4498 RepID=A0ACD5V671_AVESA
MCEANNKNTMAIRVREFDMERDLPAVEDLERRCQVGLSGDQAESEAASTVDADDDGGAKKRRKKKKEKKQGMSLYVEQIGDPFARVRHSPDYVILVAEHGEEGGEVVGVIKACVRTVSRGKKKQFAKVACLLGLRVSPSHRRLGIATELVQRAEAWCAARGAAHATMATTASNSASLALFTGRFGYEPFRRPVFLGHPVHRHRARVPSAHRVLQLPPQLAAAAYAALLSPAEFVPADLPALLDHKLTLGTYLAVERGPDPSLPPSFALLSVWDATRSLRLRVGGAKPLLRASLAAARALDRHAPWLRVPSLPDVFRPFGTYLLYGIRMSGPEGPALLRSLCRHAHNVARNNPACAVVAADLGPDDPAAAAVPHWPSFSCDEDVWCVKKLGSTAHSTGNAAADDDDWTTLPPAEFLFVDPREF